MRANMGHDNARSDDCGYELGGRILDAPACQAILREAPEKPREGKGTDAPPGNCEKPDGGRDTGHCELELDED